MFSPLLRYGDYLHLTKRSWLMIDATSMEIAGKEAEVEKGWWSRFIIIAATIFILYHVLYISDLLSPSSGIV